MAKKYILLDRDGTIIQDKHYLADPSGVELIPGAAKGLRQLQRMGYGLIIISNQSGVGRNMMTTEDVEATNQELIRQLKEESVTVDGVYYCPHTPQDNCNCRKPKTALAEEASRIFRFNLEKSIVIGDKATDIEMGKRIGATTVLVKTGKGITEQKKCTPDFVADNLSAAARMLGLVNLLDDMRELEEKLYKNDDLRYMQETSTHDLLYSL